MLNRAIEKIKAEIDKEKNNPYVRVVGEFLLQHLSANQGAAEKIASTEKNILKSLDEMRKAAEKKKVGNCAVLTDQEGFAIVLKYFGIEGVLSTAPAATEVAAPAVTLEETDKKPSIDFDVKLDDFLV